jgi:hypothetical protein
MSLFFEGFKVLGNIGYRAGSAVLAIPGAVKNGAMAVVSTAVNGAFQAVSSASSVMSGAVNMAKSAATGAANNAKDQAARMLSDGKDAAIAKSVHNYAELFFRIHTVASKIANDLSSKMAVSQVNRNELAERLEEFVKLCRFKKSDKAFIIDFCKDLKNADVNFDITIEIEMERLEKVLKPYFAPHQDYILSKLAEREQLEKLPGLTTVASPKLSHDETLTGLQTQVELLKSNSIKMILGSVVLNMILGVSSFEGIDIDALGIDYKALGIVPPDDSTNLINYLIEVSNKVEIEGKSSEKIFRDLLYRVIDNSGKGIFTRIQAKISCKVAFKLVLSLVGNLFDNLKATLLHFAHLPPAQQLEQLTQLLIQPLLDQLFVVSGTAKPIAPDDLLDQFIEAFLAQFIDRIHQPWTRKYRAICNERASRSGLIEQIYFCTLSVLLWVTGKITAPIHQLINQQLHQVLKKGIVGLCPSLSEATKNSLELGTDNALYSLKNSLLHTLQQARLTSLLPRTQDPVYQPAKELPDHVKETLTTTLDKLFEVLAIPDESQASATSQSKLASTIQSMEEDLKNLLATPDKKTLIAFLQKHMQGSMYSPEDIINNSRKIQSAINWMLSEEDSKDFLATEDGKALITLLQQNMHGNLSSLKDIIKNSVAQLLLNMAAEEDFINGALLSSFTSINASGFASTPAPVVPAEEKQRVEVELQKELGLLGGTILDAVNTATRTDKSYQTAANVHITALKQHVKAFNQELSKIEKNKDISFREHALKACEQFKESMKKLEAEITKSVDEPTKALLMPHLNDAADRVRKISDHLSQSSIEKSPIEKKRKQVEAKLNELYPLFENPLINKAKIEIIIEELDNLNASFLDVDGLFNELNKQRGIYIKRLTRSTRTPSIKPFIAIIADYKDRANTAANKAKALASARQLAEWANSLQFVKVTTKPAVKDAGMAAVYNLPVVRAATGAVLQAYGKKLFTFIGDEKNLAGIAKRTMEAYLNKPAMMPKKVRPIVGFFKIVAEKASQVRPLSPEELEKFPSDWVIINR